MEYIRLPHGRGGGNGGFLRRLPFREYLTPGIYTIDHTYVNDDLRGQGIAAELVQMAVDQIHEQGGRVRATCSYASVWLEQHK